MAQFPQIPLPFGEFNANDPTVQTASFMVNWAVVCIVCLFCMFYSQRIIARLISLVIGFWMWRRYKISLHIGSITPVWLRGRVYFKNMSILSKDYIVQVHKGYIQFRYWKSYKQNDAHETVMNEDGSIRPIPFFSTRLDGFELFLFNRSGVYRNLETLLQNKEILLQPMISSIHFSWPVEFHSRKGAVIVGNPDLPNIATFSYEVLVGLYCHKPTVDGTRTSFKIQFDDTKLSVGHNVDYKEQTLNYAARLRSRITDKTIWERLSTLFRKKRLEEIPMSEPYEWHGLDRYRKSFDKSSSEGEEYAQVSEIIQAKQLGLQYYWNSAETITSVGLDISLTDSKIHYGPWANRQRLILQSYFSPNAYRDAKLGNAAPCFFNVLITFKNKTVLRIPFREQSEDPQYSNKTEGPLTKKKPIRPFGWIDLKFADDSTIGMDIPLIPSKQRYETALRIALRDVVAHSSSNHALFFESTSFVVQVDYKSGLSWNASRECMISLDTMDMNMFFLRDHADLIQDFVNDFSSGSPPTIETFVPCIYHLEVNASNLNLNLCLNDKNIIDNHNSFLDNVYLILKSRQLQFNMTLPFVNFNPSERSLDFQIALQENDLDFSFPLNHKIGSFLNPRKQKFGLLSDCQVKGFFNYCTRQSRPSNLMLEVNIIDPDLTLFGFSLPLLSHLVSNYFGENTRFRRQGEDLLPKAINGNGVELSLDLVMLNVNGNLPDKLYNSQHTLQIKCTKLQLSLQSNASGLDLNLQTSPIKIMDSKEALLLKSVCLELQRLQSPKAHYCSNWNMMISTIGGSFGPTFIKSLVDFSECFLYHMNDHQKISGLPKPKPFSPLLLLFSLSIENIDCAYTVDQKIARFSVKDGVHMHYNNLLERGTTFLVAVPSVSLSWLQASEARGNQDVYGAEVFRIESALTFTKTYFPENHRELWINQKEFLETHDQDKRLRKLFNHKEKPTDFRLPVFFAPHFIHNFISRSRKEKKTSLGLARAPNGFQNHLLADYVRIYKFVKPFDGSETPSYAGELVRSPEELLTVNRNALKTNIPTPSPPNDEEIVFLDFNLHDCLELLITPQTVEFVKSSLEALSVQPSWESVVDALQLFCAREYNKQLIPKMSITIPSSSARLRVLEAQSSGEQVNIVDVILENLKCDALIVGRIPQKLDLHFESIQVGMTHKYPKMDTIEYFLPPDIVSDQMVMHFAIKHLSLQFHLGSKKNQLTVKQIQGNIVDYAIESLLETGLFWLQRMTGAVNDIKQRMNDDLSRREILLTALLLLVEQGDLKTLNTIQSLGEAKVDGVSAFLTFIRLALQYVQSTPKFSLLVDRPEKPEDVQKNIQKLISKILQIWGLYTTQWSQIPSWLIQRDSGSYESLDFESVDVFLPISIESLGCTVYDSQHEPSKLQFTHIQIVPKIETPLMSVDKMVASQMSTDILLKAKIESGDLTLVPSFVTFVMDFFSRKTGNHKLVERKQHPWYDAMTIVSTVFVNSLKVCIEDRNLVANLAIEGLTGSLLFQPALGDLGIYSADILSSGILSYKTLEASISESFLQNSGAVIQLKTTKTRILFNQSKDKKIISATDHLSIQLPKSLLRIQLFLEKLRDEDLPRYRGAFPNRYQEKPVTESNYPFVGMNIIVKHMVLSSELLTHFRFKYQIRDYFLSVQRESQLSFTYQYNIRDQQLSFLSENDQREHHFPLPFSFSDGTLEWTRKQGWTAKIHADVAIEKVDLKLNIELVDRLFTTYSVLSGELTDLIRIISFYGDQRKNLMRVNATESTKWQFHLQLTVIDSVISCEGVQSDLMFQSDILTGNLSSNGDSMSWGLTCNGMKIELLNLEKKGIKYCSGLIDLELQRTVQDQTIVFLVNSEKIYGSLQASAIGHLVDWVLFWQNELQARNQMRHIELKEIKENALLLMNSMHLNSPTLKTREPQLEMNLKHVALAVLMLDQESIRKKRGEALLMSLKGAKIKSNGTISDWTLHKMQFLFSSSFDQENPQHFDADNHVSNNYCSFPKVHLIMDNQQTDRRKTRKIDSNVDAVNISMDPSITTKIQKILKFYEQGRKDASSSNNAVETFGKTLGTIQKSIFENNDKSGWSLLRLQCDVKFGGTVINIVSVQPKRRTGTTDTIKLPGVTLKFDGRTVLGEAPFHVKGERGIIFDLSFQPFENTIKPEIVEFFQEVLLSLRKSNEKPKRTAQDWEAALLDLNSYDNQYKHQVSVMLRFASSKINLTCSPLSNVVGSVNIESADVIASFIPRDSLVKGHRFLNFTLKVKNLGSVLRHEFSPEDCLRADIERIALNTSVDFVGGGLSFWNQISIPRVSIHMNARQFQDGHIFYHMWLKTKPASLSIPKSKTQEDKLGLVFALKELHLTCDWGPSIGRSKLGLKDVTMMADLVFHGECMARSGQLGVGSVQIQTDGRFSGTVSLDQARMSVYSLSPQEKSPGLELVLSVERFFVQLQHQYERLLIIDLNPIVVQLEDIWTEEQLKIDTLLEMDSLSFCISRQTIPHVMQFIDRILSTLAEKKQQAILVLQKQFLHLQKQSFVHIAPPRQQPSLLGFSSVVVQRIQLQINKSLGTLTDASFRDPACAQIQITGLKISLEEKPLSVIKILESTQVQLDSLLLKKTNLKPISQAEERMWTLSQWLSFLNVSGGSPVLQVPKTVLHLQTESLLVENRVDYDLVTQFSGGLELALNLGLHKFIKDLVDSYTKASTEEINFTKDDTKLEYIPRQPNSFHLKGRMLFEPQLKLTGDATPKDLLKSLGLSKEEIPKHIYNTLVLKLSDTNRKIGRVFEHLWIKPGEDAFHSPKSLHSMESLV